MIAVLQVLLAVLGVWALVAHFLTLTMAFDGKMRTDLAAGMLTASVIAFGFLGVLLLYG